jgi:hypothetical protein
MHYLRSALVVLVTLTGLAGCGNKGEDTSCPDFLKMNDRERGEVIDKMGFSPQYTTKSKQVAAAVRGCTRARGTSDENDTIEVILGP